jgi:recombinational DNA repair protein (RecF pathway)
MERCALCKTEVTVLYENGVPICLKCANTRTNPKPPAAAQQTQSALLQDILETSARIDEVSAEFDQVMRQIPSDLPHPHGVQRIKNVSAKLSRARQELMKAHRRLDEHLDRGIVSEDLKRSG